MAILIDFRAKFDVIIFRDFCCGGGNLNVWDFLKISLCTVYVTVIMSKKYFIYVLEVHARLRYKT